MKPLKESIFSDVEDIVNDDTVLIEQFLKNNYDIRGTYTINKDGTVDVKGTIWLMNKSVKAITNGAFQFGKVSGSFYCSDCKKLKSLEGAPKEIEEDFYCIDCPKLTSLKGAPKNVGGGFYCTGCDKLTSLKGAPEEVGWFDCSYCENLTSLKGAPRAVGKNFGCDNCPNLKSLEGAPEKVGGVFQCSYCSNLTITDQDRKKYNIED